MRAGALRRRLVIQQRVTTLNEYFEDVGVWSTLATVYGAIRALSGQERTANVAQQVQATVTHEVRLRYGAAAVTPKMRIVYSAELEYLVDDAGNAIVDHASNRILANTVINKAFDVESVADPDGRQRELQLLCREVL